MATAKKAAKVNFAKASTIQKFARVVADLEKLCGKKARPLKDVKDGFAFYLDSGKARSFKLEKVHTDFLKRGCFVFDTDPACEKTRIAVLPTANKYEAIALMKPAGPNWNVDTKKIIAWLKKLEKTQPFIVTGISEEHVSGKFTTKIKDAEDLTYRLLDFSPDVSDDPMSQIDELRKTGEFCLWWT